MLARHVAAGGKAAPQQQIATPCAIAGKHPVTVTGTGVAPGMAGKRTVKPLVGREKTLVSGNGEQNGWFHNSAGKRGAGQCGNSGP